MNCPRCRMSLNRVDYEGVETDMCPECWGFWLDTGELELVLDNRDFQFSEDERRSILDVMGAAATGPTQPAACPKCEKPMERLDYDESVHLVLDRCPQHGIWLDTGEMRKIQAVAEKSAGVHRMLLSKLGL